MSDNISEPWGDTVLVEFDEHRIAWVRFNRPDKRKDNQWFVASSPVWVRAARR